VALTTALLLLLLLLYDVMHYYYGCCDDAGSLESADCTAAAIDEADCCYRDCVCLQ
jgi:hypothetical protein